MAYFNELSTDPSKADAQFTIPKIAENMYHQNVDHVAFDY
jgi:hypothetical protein